MQIPPPDSPFICSVKNAETPRNELIKLNSLNSNTQIISVIFEDTEPGGLVTEWLGRSQRLPRAVQSLCGTVGSSPIADWSPGPPHHRGYRWQGCLSVIRTMCMTKERNKREYGRRMAYLLSICPEMSIVIKKILNQNMVGTNEPLLYLYYTFTTKT